MEQKEWALPVSRLSAWPARARRTLCAWDAAELSGYFQLDALCHPHTVVLSSPTEGSRTRLPLLGFNKTQWRMTSVIFSQPPRVLHWPKNIYPQMGFKDIVLYYWVLNQRLNCRLHCSGNTAGLLTSVALLLWYTYPEYPECLLTRIPPSAYVCEIYKH